VQPRRIAASLLALTLVTSSCAGSYGPRTIQPGHCERSWPCTVAIPWLSVEQRSELVETLDERVADRTLIAVAYTGERLRFLPECVIEGRYAWRDATLERRLESDKAAFVVEDPLVADSFVRVDDTRGTSFVATRRITSGRVASKPHDPACSEATHVIEEVIVGVALEADRDARELPVALMLDELPVEVRPPPRPERVRDDADRARNVALGIAGVTLLVLMITVSILTSDDVSEEEI
jgi:transposase